ncbi:UNVERIFIED_CONTAM: hypothetical protein Slati_0973600 [Sesamum latifolium]|uniref:RNase H type-1 domain-containing protein n=1 Tax=Sesamum latifolium TaxID=2727402 RepID=A0AAW2XT77_9LAMI
MAGAIAMILRGPAGGDSANARKALVRAARGNQWQIPTQVLNVNLEQQDEISFSRQDLDPMRNQNNDALVISATLSNFWVKKVLVDSRSSADIIFYDAYAQLGIDNAQLRRVNTPLTGFSGEMIEPLGEVTLPLFLGSYPKRSTKMVKFLVVKAPSAYNIILGRPSLNIFRAIASTYHMKLKFPTSDGVGEATGDERMSKECYANTLKRSREKLGEIEADEKGKKKLNEVNHGARDPPADAWEDPRMRRVEAIEELKIINLSQDGDEKLTKIGTAMSPDVGKNLTQFLKKNTEVFAWSMTDLYGILPDIITHQLNVDLKAKPVKQKKRMFGATRSLAIKDKACSKDPFALPRIDTLVDSTSGCEMLSFLDAYQGYNQIPLAPEDQEKASFVTDHGVFCYNVMPFGLKNAAKCTFGVRGGKFLGYMISERGIEANLEKIRATMDMPPPRSIREVQKLAGKLAALNRFISRSADKGLPFFKRYLVSPPLLTKPKVGETLCVYLAVSESAISAVLVRQEGREHQPIYYVSIVLQGAEIKYSQIEKLPSPWWSRMVKWAVELSEFGIEFCPRSAVKAQVLADFVVELATDEAGISTPTRRISSSCWGQKIVIYSDSQLVVNQVRGSYEARDEKMAKYFVKAKNLLDKFEEASVVQVSRTNNAAADQLAKLASSMSAIRSRKITFISSKSAVLQEQEKIMWAAPTPTSWKEEIVRFLTEGIEPESEKDAKSLRRKASHFVMVDGQLYKHGFSQPFLKCLTPEEGNYVL